MYTVHQAKTNLSKLIRKAQNGETIIIARGKTPVAKLIGISKVGKKRVPGRWKGKFRIHRSFFEPMTMEELGEWGME